MRAWHAPLAIEDVHVDEPGSGEVLVSNLRLYHLTRTETA